MLTMLWRVLLLAAASSIRANARPEGGVKVDAVLEEMSDSSPLTEADFALARQLVIDPANEAELMDSLYEQNHWQGDIRDINDTTLAAFPGIRIYQDGDEETDATRQGGMAQVDRARRWPNGRVPYVMGWGFSSHARALIGKVMLDLAARTCIRFVPRQAGDRDYVSFQTNTGQGCSSGVGRYFGQTTVTLDSACLGNGPIQHEIMHSLGFFHEQNRPDRDNHIEILWNNVHPMFVSAFNKFSVGSGDMLGTAYDCSSVMQYSPYAFPRYRGLQTIRARNPQTCRFQYADYSDTDIYEINKYYECDVDVESEEEKEVEEESEESEEEEETVLLLVKPWNRMDMVWWDRASGAQRDFSVWRQAGIPLGWFRLGDHVGVDCKQKAEESTSGYCVPRSMGAHLVAKSVVSNAIKYPVSYTKVWGDHGSGAIMDGAFWKPNPPDGYKCLGYVATEGYDPPKTTEIVCLRDDLVVPAEFKGVVWNEDGSGADTDVTVATSEATSSDGWLDKRIFHAYTFVQEDRPLYVIRRNRVRFQGAPEHNCVRPNAKLQIKSTPSDELELVWSNKGSGSWPFKEFSIWRQRDSALTYGWRRVGHYIGTPCTDATSEGPSGYCTPVNWTKVYVTKSVINDQGQLRNPLSYTMVWGDYGSGAHMDGAIWRPNAPAGYSCLGYVATEGYCAPSTSEIACIRDDLLQDSEAGSLLWMDKGSGAQTDVSIRAIVGGGDVCARLWNSDRLFYAYTPTSTRDAFPLKAIRSSNVRVVQ